MARFLNRIQMFAAFFATILLVTSAFSDEKEPKPSKACLRISDTWPHGRCYHSAVCNHFCQKVENAISGQCVFFFKKCQCQFCDEEEEKLST